MSSWDKQDRIIAAASKVARSASQPSQIEREMARVRPEVVKKEPRPEVSFYNPANPLNGIHKKSKAEQLEIKARVKAEKKALKGKP